MKNYSRRYFFIILIGLVVSLCCHGAGTKIEKTFGVYKISLAQNFDSGLGELVIKKGQQVVFQERDIDSHYRLGNSFAEGKKQPRLYQNITGNRIPNLIVSNWTGGAHCCHIVHVFELGKEFRKIATVQANSSDVRFVDLDQDGILEIEFWDGAIDYQFASFAGSPGGRVVLKFRKDHYEIAFDHMKKDPPNLKEVEEIKKTLTKAFRVEQTPSLPYEFLKIMMDLSYSGNLKKALKLADDVWPSGRPGLERFKAEFSESLHESEYWREFSLFQDKL